MLFIGGRGRFWQGTESHPLEVAVLHCGSVSLAVDRATLAVGNLGNRKYLVQARAIMLMSYAARKISRFVTCDTCRQSLLPTGAIERLAQENVHNNSIALCPASFASVASQTSCRSGADL
jgi:hypothetical protein